jgi:hypothetical protein
MIIKKEDGFMDWGSKIVESKAFSIIIKGAFWVSIAIALFIIFMIGNFLFKLYFLDYRYYDTDGGLKPPIEEINKEHSN